MQHAGRDPTADEVSGTRSRRATTPGLTRRPAELTDVIVIGGGMTGLAAAEALVAQGLSVQVVEAAPAVGGLARSIIVGGRSVEAYYHHAFPQDRELRDLIDRLGLADRFEWRQASTAVLDNGHVYPFDTLIDLLRFAPLSLPARVRLGLGAAMAMVRGPSRRADGMRVGEAGPLWFGRSGYEALWRPLLEGKFGPMAPDVAAAWLVARIRQRAQARKGGNGDRPGYLHGGFGVVAERLAEELARNGVHISCGAPVDSLTREGGHWLARFDGRQILGRAVVVAASGMVLSKLVHLPEAYRRAVDEIPYRAVVCVLLELDRPLSRDYWINLTQRSDLACLAVIEHTNFIPAERYGGRHLVYLTHYVEPEGRAWNAEADEVVGAIEDILRAINGDFECSWIVATHVSRDRWAQPVPLAGGPMPGLPLATGLPGLFHASLAHIYPDDRGVSLALELGRRVAATATAWLAEAEPTDSEGRL